MAELKAVYESEEEIPESYRDLYAERNGQFELAGIEGIKTENDVQRVQQGAQKEREAHKQTKQQLQQFEPLKPIVDRYGSVDDLIGDLDRIDELKQAAEGKLDDGKMEELVEKRLKSKLAPVEREKSQLEQRYNEAQEQIQQFQERERQRTIHDAVRRVASEKNVVSSALDDVLMLAERVFEVDEDGNVVTKDNIGATPGVKPEVWLTEMAEKRPHWWPQSAGGGGRGSGGGGNGASNPWSRENWNMTEQGRIYREDPDKAQQLAKAAGTTIGGQKPPARK